MKLSAFSRAIAGSALCAGLVLLAPTDLQAQNACSTTNDVFMNPFNRQSAHHLPIGTGARYAGDNHPATRDWLRANRFAINVGGPWGADVVATGSSDMVRTVNGRPFGPQASVIGLPTNIRLPRNGLITSIELNRSNNFDGVAVVHDRVAGTTHELYQYDWNNGSPVASIHRRSDIRGLGHGTSPGQRVGMTATGVSMLFGLLRGDQINTPGHPIEHALQMVLPLDRPNECNVMLGMGIILPATTRDGHAGQSGNNSGNIRYGELLALPPNVNLNSLGLSEPGMRLARAIQGYGIRVVDSGGCGAGAIRTDQHVSSHVYNQLWNDIPKIYPHIRVVTNGEWQPGLTAIGGGQPIARNCALDASASQQQVSSPSSQPAASTPQSGQSGSTASNQNQQASTGSTSSVGGTLSWPAVRNAQNYYVEIRDTTSRRERVYGKMAPPSESGCSNGGTCQHAVPSLPSDRSYQWNVRAVVNGVAQNPTPWQPVGGSSQQSTSASAPAASTPQSGQSGSTASNQNQQASTGSTSSVGGTLSWPAVRNGQNYYVEIRDTTSRRERVYGKMAPPSESGCSNGGTCQHPVPSLPSDRSFQWNVRAVVNGVVQNPTPWQPVGNTSDRASSVASDPASQQSSAPSSDNSASSASSSTSSNGVMLSWGAVPRAQNYYLEVRDTTSRPERVYGRMVPPKVGSCVNGSSCEYELSSSLRSDRTHQWAVGAVVGGEFQGLRNWRPIP